MSRNAHKRLHLRVVSISCLSVLYLNNTLTYIYRSACFCVFQMSCSIWSQKNSARNYCTSCLLRLGTPNSVLTDLVIFLFFLYLIQLTYDSHTVPMLLFSLHTHASCTPHFINLCAVHGYVSFSFFHSATTMRLHHVLLLFHSMAMLDARFHLMLLGTRIF